jgi:YndJ-like protein
MEAQRWSVMSAGLGAVAWLAAPWLPIGAPPAFGSIEHVFVFAPLVAVPLALALVSALLPSGRYVLAQRMQPAAAAMVLASLFVAKGSLAAGLTAGWLIMAMTVAISGVRSKGQGAARNPSLLAAHLFLPVGAVWLLLSRLGAGPRSFSALTVFLAAVHFHFSGFTLQVLIAATGDLLPASATRLRAAHRYIAIGAIVGIAAIAAGNGLASPALKAAGVAAMVLSVMGFAVTSASVALASSSRVARALLLVSAGSVASGMVVAAIYGAGEVTGSGWIGIPRMVRVHGLVDAVGFTFCALGAHLRTRRVFT